MSASDYAAWYAAIVSTVVAIAEYISHRQKNAAVRHAIADLHPRELIGASGQDLRVVIRNVGGMPTTISHVVPMQTAWRCPGWMLGSKVGRKLAGLKPAGGNQLRLSSSRTFVLAANGAELRLVFSSWPDDRAALKGGRYWALTTHTAAMGPPVFLRVRHSLV